MQPAMHKTRRNDQEVPAMQFNSVRAGEFVGGGPIYEEEEFKSLVRMPRHTAGNLAADPADMDEHRQPDFMTIHSNRLRIHAGGNRGPKIKDGLRSCPAQSQR